MKFPRLSRDVASLGIVLLLAGSLSAAEDRKQPSPDETAIRQAAKSYLEALNRGDVKALLAAWTADGDYVDQSGKKFRAHDLIQREFSSSAASKEQPRVAENESSLRFVTGDVAIEDGTNEIETPAGDVTAGNFTAIWVKRGGKWLLASIREYAPAGEANQSPLAGLEWMVGHWTGESKGMKYEFSARWSEDGHFLLRDFEVSQGGKLVMRGTQRIGWDAVNKTIRSWAFDSQGGYGEGVWGNEGHTWYVENKGALADGRRVESINVYAVADDGSVEWRVEGSKIDGDALPELTVRYVKTR